MEDVCEVGWWCSVVDDVLWRCGGGGCDVMKDERSGVSRFELPVIIYIQLNKEEAGRGKLLYWSLQHSLSLNPHNPSHVSHIQCITCPIFNPYYTSPTTDNSSAFCFFL